MSRRFAHYGFTLIELLIVITIIVIIMMVIGSAVFQARQEARDVSRISDAEQIKLAVKLYYEAYGEYPSYPEGAELVEGEGIYNDLLPFLSPGFGDPLNTDEFYYVYDSAFSCGSAEHIAVIVQLEANPGNAETLCGSTVSEENGEYIVLVAELTD